MSEKGFIVQIYVQLGVCTRTNGCYKMGKGKVVLGDNLEIINITEIYEVSLSIYFIYKDQIPRPLTVLI